MNEAGSPDVFLIAKKTIISRVQTRAVQDRQISIPWWLSLDYNQLIRGSKELLMSVQGRS
jgi:hypothetical protein